MSYGPEEGSDHTCPDCGAKWWDADGGCDCTKCRHCGKVGDEDFAPDGYCADCKDAEIERLNAALKQAVSEKESIKASNLNSLKSNRLIEPASAHSNSRTQNCERKRESCAL